MKPTLPILRHLRPSVYLGLLAYKFGLRLTDVPDVSPVLSGNKSAVISATPNPKEKPEGSFQEDTETIATALFSQAKAHVKNGDKKRAVAVLKDIVSKHPDTRAGQKAQSSLTRSSSSKT